MRFPLGAKVQVLQVSNLFSFLIFFVFDLCLSGSGACTKSRVCVSEGGDGTRALVVVGGKASVMVAWEAHTGHTRTTKHHHGPHHQSRCVCV